MLISFIKGGGKWLSINILFLSEFVVSVFYY